MTFEYDGEVLRLVTHRYANGNLAVEAVDADGAPYARVSVNMGDPLPDGVFYLKDWSENAQLAEVLIDSGLIEIVDDGSVWPVASGYVVAFPYRLK